MLIFCVQGPTPPGRYSPVDTMASPLLPPITATPNPHGGYYLRWTHHSHNLSSSIYDECLASAAASNCGFKTDTELRCSDSVKLYAHRAILASSSPFLSHVLKSVPYCCSSTGVLILEDIESKDVKLLLEFIYKGEVNVPSSQIGSLMSAGISLQIRGLGESQPSLDRLSPLETVINKFVNAKNISPVDSNMRTSPISWSPAHELPSHINIHNQANRDLAAFDETRPSTPLSRSTPYSRNNSPFPRSRPEDIDPKQEVHFEGAENPDTKVFSSPNMLIPTTVFSPNVASAPNYNPLPASEASDLTANGPVGRQEKRSPSQDSRHGALDLSESHYHRNAPSPKRQRLTPAFSSNLVPHQPAFSPNLVPHQPAFSPNLVPQPPAFSPINFSHVFPGAQPPNPLEILKNCRAQVMLHKV